MPYTLYTDRDEIFECDVNVRNASLKDSLARLVLESNDGVKFMFEGTIESGKCKIPIRRMHGVLKEWQKGKMHLEIIVENVYFKPWASTFQVEKHTAVKIEEITQNITEAPNIGVSIRNEKKTLLAESKKPQPNPVQVARVELKEICKRFNITKANLNERREDFKEIVMEYFRTNREYIKDRTQILRGLVL